jgi:NADH:ubiquinone oxidoreductase subunit 5 (subunit L)/multisubunit Na+/H+ antiporter MnhA subunit
MGGLINQFPFAYILFLIGSMSLMAFPFFSGFYSKDAIFELLISNNHNYGISIYIIALIATMLTSFYSIRLIYYVFYGNTTRIKCKKLLNHISESAPMMTLSMTALALLSITSGFILKNIYAPASPFWRNSIMENNNQLDVHFIDHLYKITPSVFSYMGIGLAIFAYKNHGKIALKIQKTMYPIFFLFNKKFFYDAIYNLWGRNYLKFSLYTSYFSIDRGILETIGSTGLYDFSQNAATWAKEKHTGYIFHIVFVTILSLISVAMITLI